MIKIKVEIQGEKLLMNNPKSMQQQEKTRMQTKEYDPKKETEIRLYKNNQGQLYIPNTAIMASIIKGASWKKKGKNALIPLIAGGVRILEEEIILTPQEYETDIRTVVIKRQRILRARPRINNWKLNFTIEFNEIMLYAEDIKGCLQDAGERVGIMDYRPTCRGNFGTFKITKWEMEETK